MELQYQDENKPQRKKSHGTVRFQAGQRLLVSPEHDLRAEYGLVEVSNLTGYSQLKQEQMVVNAGVIICEHFKKRLRLYVLVTFGELDNDLTKKQEEKENLVDAIMRVCKSTTKTDTTKVLYLRDILTPDGND